MVIALTLLIIAAVIFVSFFVVIFIGHAIVHSAKKDFEMGKALKRVSISSLVVTLFFTVIVGVVGLGDPDALSGNNSNSETVAVSTNGDRRRPDSDSRSTSDRNRRTTSTTVRSSRDDSSDGGSSSRRRTSDDSTSASRDGGGSSSSSSSSSSSWTGGSSTSGADYVIEASGASSAEVYTVVEKWKYKDSRMRTQKFTVAIQLLREDIQAAEQFLKDVDRRLRGDQNSYARELGLHPSGNDYEDTKQFYILICREFYRDDEDRFDDIVKGLEKIFTTLGFSDLDKLYFVVTMIQNIEYDDPGGEIGIFPPTITLAKEFGDCDTKSILAYVILEKLGFDVAIMGSEEYSHAMLGVATSATGKYLTLGGKRYYFLEMTYPNWWLGEIAPDCNNLRYWYAFKLD